MQQRQLNVRSDEAAALASELSARLGSTTTDVVLRALRSFKEQTEPRDTEGLTAAQRRRYEAIRSAAREAAEQRPPGLSSDHSWLYGEDGLPR